MSRKYDGRELIAKLKDYLPKGATVLELGMGPGKDLDILSQSYSVTGSDNSALFLNLYRKKKKDADLLLIDAVTIKTERKFDCIYSNKVLHHLTREQLSLSLQRQKQLLNKGGILLHSFWYGDGEERHHNLLFTYYTKSNLTELVKDHLKVLEIEKYKEMENDDSLYLLGCLYS